MNIVVVATHPDDEALGCGGTLLKRRDAGDRLFWVIVTKACAESGYAPDFIARRAQEIRAVARRLGFAKVFELGYPTTKLDRVPAAELVARMAAVFDEVRPEVLFLPFRGDVHSDHRVVFEAAFSCAKTFRRGSIRQVLMMEALSETEFAPPLEDCVFAPNLFVDISRTLERKIAAVKLYRGEIKKHPFPRSEKSIRALAAYRGAAAGCSAAEAFMILKELA